MFHNEMLPKGVTDIAKADVNEAYPSLLHLLPVGIKGLAVAALTAAIVASLASKANSIATIFTLDIYNKAINKNATEKNLVNTGKISVVVSMFLAILMSLAIGEALMGKGKQGFEYIQEYTGFVSPGIFAMFILGFFWKRTTSNAALFATIGGFVFSVILKFLPFWTNLSWLEPFGFSKLTTVDGKQIYEIPFLDRMGFVFIACIIGMSIITNIDNRRGIKPKGLEVDTKMFRPSPGFAIGALAIVVILTAIYTIFW
jgi:SSS family solute:Na+ symporter